MRPRQRPTRPRAASDAPPRPRLHLLLVAYPAVAPAPVRESRRLFGEERREQGGVGAYGVRGISIRGELSISGPSTGTQLLLFLFCYRLQVVGGGAQAASSVRGWHEATFAAAAFVWM